MVNLDDPRHARMRGIVSRAFTPRRVSRIEEDIRRVAARTIDDVVRRGAQDFVDSVATQLPFQVICNMMGVPDEHRAEILAQVDHTTQGTGVEASRRRLRLPGSSLRAMARLHYLVAGTAAERRMRPTDDLISALVHADIDGKHLTSRELGSFFALLLVAGVETTRNVIAHGLKLLTDHREQRTLLLSDIDRHLPGAIDEIVRYASPIIQFRRTLAGDYEMNGHTFRTGDNVVLFYNSANRDEAVFDDPNASTSPAAPIRMSASVAVVPTSVSAPSWRVRK
jgi:cytochrome P450